MKIAFTQKETYSEQPAVIQHLLTVLAKVTWADDTECGQDPATGEGWNGPIFQGACSEADHVLRSYGMYPTYVDYTEPTPADMDRPEQNLACFEAPEAFDERSIKPSYSGMKAPTSAQWAAATSTQEAGV